MGAAVSSACVGIEGYQTHREVLPLFLGHDAGGAPGALGLNHPHEGVRVQRR